jgi:outer membrane receptor protein involved in Fe transport
MSNQNFIFGRSASILALAVAAAGVAAPAFAQAGAASDEIVVTGSHLGKSAFNSPTPVNVIGDERMKALANPSLADTLNQIPSFRAVTTPASNSFRINGNIGARSMDLRGLGTARTLVLVDGRKFVPSSDNGTVDLNAVPSAMIKRAEVVTGGASAQYGADAVSGVVNLILDTKFTGFKFDLNSGISGQGDNQNYYASGTAGQDFAGGRGHWIFGVEAQKERGIGSCWTRDFCDRHTNYPANAGYDTTARKSLNGLPATLVRNNTEFVYSTNPNIQSYVSGGSTKVQTTIGSQMVAALKNKGFDSNGNLSAFPYGDNLGGTFMIGGGDANFNAVDRNALWGFFSRIITPTKHFSTLGHVDFDLADNITASGEVLYSTVTGRTYGGYPVLTPGIKLTSGENGLGNPFLSASARAALLAADPGITQININVVHPEIGSVGTDGTSYNQTFRSVFALKGDLGTHNASWDASYEYGKTDGQIKVQNVRLLAFDGGAAAGNSGGAVDAVTPPTGYNGPIYTTPGGAPVICAGSVGNVNQYNGNGCIPVNVLAPKGLTPAMVNKYFSSEWAKREIKQNAFAANLRGELFNTWAGPVSAAVGYEWRKDNAEGPIDAQTDAGVFLTANVSKLAAVERTVSEGYVEVGIPLLTDQPFAKNLSINGAKRWTHYSTSGDAQTWKAGAVYEPNDQVLLRVTQSSDIRAPTAAELNPNVVQVLSPLPDPFSGGAARNISAFLGGNINLKNEEAVTKTAGVVLKPSFIPGFRLSTDYYNIKVAKAIDSFTAATVIPTCFNQNLLCELITFQGAYKASPVVSVAANFQNLSKLHAEGVEIVANYGFDALGGKFDATFNGNYVIDLKSIGATGIKVKFDGVTGNLGSVAAILGVPQYKLDGLLTYSRDNWSVTAHGRFIPEGILDQGKVGPQDAGYDVNRADSIETNRVDSAAYLDLSGTYSPTATIFGSKTQIYGSINNVFDKSEPDQLRLYGNGLQFDPVGRAFRLGVRANW